MRTPLSWIALIAWIAGCGARTGLRDSIDAGPDTTDAAIDARPPSDGAIDAPDAADASDASRDSPIDAGIDGEIDAGCLPIADLCGRIESCGDGDDDNCDGRVDEECPCEAGSVRSCFSGPPGRRGVGVCQDGSQICEMRGTWGPCTGGIAPQPDVCDGRDNFCDGCSARRDCELDCPSPGDPRAPDGAPFTDYPLRGPDFYPGMARSWQWRVEGGPCDRLAPRLRSFELRDATSAIATFVPQLSGAYTITLSVVTIEGTPLECSWLVHVAGPGLRIEMCYPESETQDLDLYVHSPHNRRPWFPPRSTPSAADDDASCGWHDCEAMIRQPGARRADWGYPPSPLSECEGGPQGDQWRALGFCANPRLDIDNNLAEAIGVPENINIDAPGDGQTFRVMVQNWSGTIARPVVNVYCEGRRIGTYGAAPDPVPRFTGQSGETGIGAMWRVVDVTTHVDAVGTLSCELAPLHPPGSPAGYDVTLDDPRY